MKILISLLMIMTVAFNAEARAKRMSSDMKLPTQQMLEKQTITNPAVAGSGDVLSAHAGATSAAAVTVSTFVAQPDVPRNLVMTPGSSTADVAACDIVITGTNIFDAAITETFTFANNASSATTGAKAFKTISSVAFPASCEDNTFGATWSIGYGEKLGLSRCMGVKGDLIRSIKDGTLEATQPTCVADDDEIEKNTCDVNGTMDASADWIFYFIQNFRCQP